MIRFTRRHTILSLLIMALLCGLVWRAEVEYHGWDGLKWLDYFHWAIPVGVGLFILWVNLLIELPATRRLLFNVVSIVFAILILWALHVSVIYLFASGPSGFLLELQTPEWQSKLYRYSVFVTIPFISIGTYLIIRLFKLPTSWKHLLIGSIGIIVSIPLSVLILEITSHKGGTDIVHIVKSGVLIPLWALSLGWVVLGTQKK